MYIFVCLKTTKYLNLNQNRKQERKRSYVAHVKK